MDAVAYIDSRVVNFLHERVVPVRLQANDPVLGPKFKVKWTPSLLVLDAQGEEHHRTLGFYPPEELIPSILLGMGKAKFNQPDRPAASRYFEMIISDYPDSLMAPEAVYMNGVARYIETHDATNLLNIYDRLVEEYPDSPWLTRADPYRYLRESP
jgi:tetratricopeptide (TPR) repeat protein